MKYVNDDWETNGVLTVNACPQPGYAETPLPDDHPAIRDRTGVIPPELAADRDMNSDLAQTIFTELMASAADRARVRAALVDRYANSAPQMRLTKSLKPHVSD